MDIEYQSASDEPGPSEQNRSFSKGNIPERKPKYVLGLLETPSESTNTPVSRLNSKSSSSSGPRVWSRQNYPRSRSDISTRSKTPRSAGSGADIARSAIVALAEGRGHARGEIGVAYIDLRNPELVLSQFSDSTSYIQLMTKLSIIDPAEVVLPSTVNENGKMTSLYKCLCNQFKNVNVTLIQRKYFNESRGLQYVKHLCLPDCKTVEMQVVNKYYCLAACAALLKYIEFIQNIIYAPSSLKIRFTGCEKTTLIDSNTIRKFELIENLQDVRSSETLFGVMDFTRTFAGMRLLRSNILQPPYDVTTITLRQDAVQELLDNEELFYNLETILTRFMDLDHLLSLCVQIAKQENPRTAEQKISNIIYLKTSLELVEPLLKALEHCQCPLLKALKEALQDDRFLVLMTKIKDVIHEDAHYEKGVLNMRSQKCYLIKRGVNGLLDVSRTIYTEIIDDILNMVSQLQEQYDIPMKSAFNATRGFYIHMTPNSPIKTSDLPSVFVKVTQSKNAIHCTTNDLMRMNARAEESITEIYMMSSIVTSSLLASITEQIGCLYKLSECVAMLDMLLSFAHACTVSDCYVRPEFSDTLALSQTYHPILKKCSSGLISPNDCYMSENSAFAIITGPNMSGKSTYLRQVALLQIMAQTGSFVPAKRACFRLADKILSRVGSEDDPERNASTFTLDMQEINYIIRNGSSRSLVVIDELGRGTSVEEGLGLCHALCEQLIINHVFVLFVTHFIDLCHLESIYPNVSNYHMRVRHMVSGNKEKLEYTHELAKGVTQESHYGLYLATLSTLPRSVIENAKSIIDQFASDELKTRVDNSEPRVRQQRAIYQLGMRLVQCARNHQLDDTTLRMYLKSLREGFVSEICNEQDEHRSPSPPSSNEERWTTERSTTSS